LEFDSDLGPVRGPGRDFQSLRGFFAQLKNDPGDLLAGHFDDRQIDPGAAVTLISRGYALAEVGK
jgi:hypothetical protein